MAIVLIFTKVTGGQASKGPFPLVRLEGQRICDGQRGQTIAAHLTAGWTVDGDDYLRLDVTAPVSVTWKGYAGAPATKGHFSCVNGVAYIDRRILAFADRERDDWYLLREGQHQPALILNPA
jgi:hypothetical protein